MQQDTKPADATIEASVDRIIERTGGQIVLGIPLGLGKPVQFVNCLYRRAMKNPSIELKILTALSLTKPVGKNLLETRFLAPIEKKMFGDFPELDYVAAVKKNMLPDNIQIVEFFFAPGEQLHVPQAQQSYTSVNYTHVVDLLLDEGINVMAHLVSKRERDSGLSFSLSCNPDITPELLERFSNDGADTGRPILVGQVNQNLPFMPGVCELPASEFDFVIDDRRYDYTLFSAPHMPVSAQDYAAALYTATLIEDGGTLQIGIGSFADALTQAIKLRHTHPREFGETIHRLDPSLSESGERYLGPFEIGLYGCTEMFVHGFLELYRIGVLKREVHDIRTENTDSKVQQNIAASQPNGRVLDAGFFLDSSTFYEELKNLTDADLEKLQMKPVSFVNQLYADEALKRSQRIKARFINKCLMATLLGNVVSDQLENGQIVSGVGGQYNFVAQAHELQDARSVIVLNATRGSGRSLSSNILWSYGHTTIPRHLRDIIVTEYGIADLWGKSDRDVIAEMLNIADSRFQAALLQQAKKNGKIEKSYEIPGQFRQNFPGAVQQRLQQARAKELLPDYPLGTEFSGLEQSIITALKQMKALRQEPLKLVQSVVSVLGNRQPDTRERAALERLGLNKTATMREKLIALAFLWAFRQSENSNELSFN
ncbi:MAG: acetyl-CoA hydrolase/transferase C-terminal domain-containing protein [Methyloligellaceae bacterium]